MRLPLAYRTIVAAAMLLILGNATATAARTTVARVRLDLPARPGHAATAVSLDRFTLDAVADFSLVRLTANRSPASKSRLVIELSGASADANFATEGGAGHFASLTLRQADAAGTTLRRTDFYDVRVVRIERLNSGGGPTRRVTLIANRIHDVRIPASE